jgi:hypothetical protein
MDPHPGPETVHNDALDRALTAIDELIQQEIDEGEAQGSDLDPLLNAETVMRTRGFGGR